MTTTTISTNGHPPVSLTFTRSGEDGALGAAFASDALTALLAREEEVFAWLEASEENGRLFADDPVAALRAALPDLDPALIDGLRDAAKDMASNDADIEPAQTHTPATLFADAVVTSTPVESAALVATPTQMNGWDMIVATRLGLINNGLAKLYTSQQIRFEHDNVPLIGRVEVDVTIGPPAVDTLEDTTRRLARVTFPLLGGTIKLAAQTIDVKGIKLRVTSNLIFFESTMQPLPGLGRNYDLFIDLKNKEAVYEVELADTDDPLARLLAAAMKAALQSLAGHSYRIATINLGRNVPAAVAPLIPQVADFTFIRDPARPDDTTFAALLLNDSKKPRGSFSFDASMIPGDGKAVGLISNDVFIRDMVYPALKTSFQGMAKPGQADKLYTEKDRAGAWHIRNRGFILLRAEKDPWIVNDSIDGRVDGDKLRLQLEVQADVTFLKVRISIKAFIGWQVQVKLDGKEQKIDLVMVEYREVKNSSMQWWKWLLGALGGFVGLIVVGLTRHLVSLNIPSLPKNAFEMPMQSVRWPFYEQLRLDAVTLPTPVMLQATPRLTVA